MFLRTIRPLFGLAGLILIVSLACGPTPAPPTATPQEPAKVEPTEAPEPTEPPPPTATPEPTEPPKTNAVTRRADVQKAVIQIEAQGTIVNPDFSVSYNVAGRGSGFIISESGLAITNNHVVTGAGLLKVWIGGDSTRTYNAKVLGVSECSDLAVIDIDGEDFPYLEWHEGPINVGLDVYAAGVPLGEPEFTLTRGIVAKERANGETSWASVDYVIEHDATINPGNSGGPLIDDDGRVVGINYSGRSSTNQYYAIGRDLAVKVINVLQSGKDLDTLGINGEAFATDTFSGIWVYSVEPGSPAGKVGVTGGDIVTTLQDLVLATDGTMADYCDILRSHSPEDTLNIEILRYATSEVLQGQINGDALKTVVSFADVVNDTTNIEETGGSGTYSGYVTVTDDTGAIQMNIPKEWTDVNGANWNTDWGGKPFVAAAISASANLNAYNNTYGESGVFFAASDRLSQIGGYIQLLDGVRSWYESDCKLEGRYDYEDVAFEGRYDLWESCGSANGTVLVLSARPIKDPTAYLILVEVKLVKETDLDALEQILQTFDVVGSLP
jgi:serine protease Do